MAKASKATSPYLISDALHFGWQRTKQRFGFVVTALFLAMLAPQVPAFFADTFPDESFPAIVLGLLSMFLSLIIGRGILMIAIKEGRSKEAQWDDFIGTLGQYGRYFLVTVVYSLIVLAGLLLLIVPGIIWSIKYQYMVYLVVDRDLGIREAMDKSAAMTSGVKWELLAFEFVSMIINLIGMMALFIGLFMTIPATAIAQGRIYNRLLAKK